MGDNAVIHCEFPDIEALYRAYMPFVHGGGILVKYGRRDADKSATLGNKVSLTIKLPGDRRTQSVSGKVIWIASGGDASLRGLGVQFDAEGAGLRDQIDAMLGEQITSGNPTDTL